jgi:hypothetical protein
VTTIPSIAANTSLPEYPRTISDDDEHVRALADSAGIVIRRLRECIKTATEAEDSLTARHPGRCPAQRREVSLAPGPACAKTASAEQLAPGSDRRRRRMMGSSGRGPDATPVSCRREAWRARPRWMQNSRSEFGRGAAMS